MATLAQGQAVKLHCAISQAITVTPSTGGRATVSANGPGNVSYAQKTISAAETFGPYLSDTDVVIAAVAGSLSYDLGTASLVDGAGNVFGLGTPGDQMRKAGGVGQVSAGLSTAVVGSQAIPVASTRVRIAWQKSGSAGELAGTERLYIAVNEANDVAGLVATQDPRRRVQIAPGKDSLAPGEAVILTSKAPITMLHFSGSAAILSNKHSIDTTYEEVAA